MAVLGAEPPGCFGSGMGRKPTIGFRMDPTDERALLPEVPISAIDPIQSLGSWAFHLESGHP